MDSQASAPRQEVEPAPSPSTPVKLDCPTCTEHLALLHPNVIRDQLYMYFTTAVALAAHHFEFIRLLFGLPPNIAVYLLGTLTKQELRSFLTSFKLRIMKVKAADRITGTTVSGSYAASRYKSGNFASQESLGFSTSGFDHANIASGFHGVLQLLRDIQSPTTKHFLRHDENRPLFAVPGFGGLPNSIPALFSGYVVTGVVTADTDGILRAYQPVAVKLAGQRRQLPSHDTLPNGSIALYLAGPTSGSDLPVWLAVCFVGGDYCCNGIGTKANEAVNAAKLHAAYHKAHQLHCPETELALNEEAPDAPYNEYLASARRFGAKSVHGLTASSIEAARTRGNIQLSGLRSWDVSRPACPPHMFNAMLPIPLDRLPATIERAPGGGLYYSFNTCPIEQHISGSEPSPMPKELISFKTIGRVDREPCTLMAENVALAKSNLALLLLAAQVSDAMDFGQT